MNSAPRHASAAEQAYVALKERITRGELEAGTRLTEEQLAVELGTSRTPVREAMRKLVADGLLQHRPNVGTFVGTWTESDIRQLMDLRAMLEAEVAAAATPSMDADRIAELMEIQDEIEARGADISAENLRRIDVLNRRFHACIAQAARNPRLTTMLTKAIEAPVVRQTLARYSVAQLARSFGHHRELIDAFRAGDAEWARHTMSSHVHAARFALLGERKSDDG